MATTPYPFVSGSVLTALELNSTFNIPTTTKTADYTLTAADAGTRIYMNSASATTITVNTSIFEASDVVDIVNIGSGTTTITAGTATVSTSGSLALVQYGGGRLVFTSVSASIFFLAGAGSSYGTATGGIGAPTAVTIDGVNYEYLQFNSTGTLTVTKAGFFDYLAVGGGGGNAYIGSSRGGGGGGAGCVQIGTVYLSANQTITIGAGGSTGIHSTPKIASHTIIKTNLAAAGCASNNTTQAVGGDQGRVDGIAATVYESTFGFNGGSSGASTNGGGGGGVGGGGGNGAGTTGGTAGAGFDVSIFIGGSELRKGMGGGGGGSVTGGTAATDGVAGSTNTTPSNGNANSGGGGGGGVDITSSGNGGSGICYIRWVV
jgi:fibronectin-binding autotransporter adhesin